MRQGYANRQVKDICTKGSSQVAQKDLEGLTGEYPIYGASGLIKNVDFYHQEKEYIGLVKDGSGIGRVMFLPPKSSVIGTLQYILPKEGYNIRYIGYCLQSLKLDKYKQGAAIPHIYFKDYGEAQIFVADNPDEQQRIVSLLDAEFAKIDALKANAERNLQNAKDLFQAVLKKELEPKEGKNIVPLGVLCEFSQGLQVDVKNQSEVQESGMVRFLRIIDFTQGTESPRYINKPIDKFFLKKDEIAIVRYGASAGFVCYGYEGVIANNLFKVDVRNNFRLISKYLYYVLKSDIFQSVIRKGVGGVAMPAISFGMIKGIEIPYPSSVQEQIVIVARLDALNEKCKILQANYEKTIVLCDDLKQALLRKAFNGEI